MGTCVPNGRGYKVKQILEMKVQGRKEKGRPRIMLEGTSERIGRQRNKTMGETRRMINDEGKKRMEKIDSWSHPLRYKSRRERGIPHKIVSMI